LCDAHRISNTAVRTHDNSSQLYGHSYTATLHTRKNKAAFWHKRMRIYNLMFLSFRNSHEVFSLFIMKQKILSNPNVQSQSLVPVLDPFTFSNILLINILISSAHLQL